MSFVPQKPGRPETGAPPFAAIVLLLCAVFFFACLDASAKVLVLAGLDPSFVVWCRYTCHMVLAFFLLRGWANPAVFRMSDWRKQILRAAFLFGSTLCNFLALRHLQLAETVSIFFLSPMVVTAFAGPILGEWAGWRRWLAILVGFCGIVVMARPGSNLFQFAFVYSFAAMLFYSFYVLMTRQMSESETPESMIFYSALLPSLLFLPAVPATASAPPDLASGALLLCLGVFGGTGHWLLIKAYRFAPAIVLAPFSYFQIIWMVMFGYLVFGDLPETATVVGTVIIVASGLYIAQREWMRSRPKSAVPPA